MGGTTENTDGNFGVLLRSLRERAGLTQQELAERAGLTPHAVSSLERGTRSRPYPHTVRALADALQASEADRAALVAAVPSRRARQSTIAAGEPVGLVVPPTPLYGRTDDLATVADLCRSDQASLVTLTGPGGVGKTRLAAALSELLADEYADGVVQISLAPLSDATTVVPTIGRALGLTGGDGPEVFDAVVTHLRSLNLLLVLDNFEHLLSAAPAVGRLSALCPGVTVLVSSRSPLRVRAEREYAVEPLDLPELGVVTTEELGLAAAGSLVLDRARAVSPRLVMTPDDVAACAELCHQLAGLPLAIELATARLRMLTPRMLLDRLHEATTSAGARDLPERQRTMRATLDWSFGHLEPDQQWLFTVLGAFRGGATLEAIEAVVEASGDLAEGQVLGLLEQLAEHSLIVVRHGIGAQTRFSMLAPVAQYARSLLVGDRATCVGRAHAQVYLDLVEQAAAGYERDDQVAWLTRVEADEANILVAVERSLDAGDAATAGRITWFMWLYWWLRGQVTVGRRLAEQCLDADLPATERGRVHLAAATMSYAGGDHAASAAHWAEADRLGAEQDDAEVRAKGRAGTGLAALSEGDLETAALRFRAALGFSWEAGRSGGDWMASLCHVWLGTVLLLQAQPGAAVPEIELGLESARARGDRLCMYVALYNLSQAAIALGDLPLARRHVEEGIALSEQTRDRANLAYFLETLAVVESAEGRPERVPVLLGAAAGLRETVGADVYAYYLPDEALRASAEQSARSALGEDAYESGAKSGRALDLGEIVGLALANAGS